MTGQPLGYSGSWPLFAFTHHVLVWWAAEQVRPGILFERYALLGDDILITDPLVAEQYRLGLQRLGVKISTHKSLISSTGAAEFAKQFLVKDMRVNLSPVSMKALCGFHHPYGLLAIHEKSKISRFSTLMRIGGAGYKTRSVAKSPKSIKWKRFRVLFGKSRLQVEYLLGDGCPLNPYLLGKLKRYALERLKPRELHRPPVELFEFEGMADFLEYSLLRSWMMQWLNYLKWYCCVSMDPWVELDQFLEAPVVYHYWEIRQTDPELVRFGLLWRLHNIVQDVGLD